MTISHQQLIHRMIEHNVITKSGQLNKQIKTILRLHPDLYDAILMATLFLPSDTSTRARIHAIRSNMSSTPTCETCGKGTTFNERTGKFNSFCPNVKGSTCVSASDRVRKQQESTTLERYGVTNPSKSRDVCSKRLSTMQERYGGTSPMASDDVKNKQKATLKARHGVTNASNVPGATDARKATNLAKYGATSFIGSKVPDAAIASLSNRQYCEDNIRDFTIDEIAQILRVSSHTVRKYLHLHSIDTNIASRSGTSPERDIMRFFESVGIAYEYNNRTLIPHGQLDFVIPSHKLAVEYVDIYTHSELAGNRRMYHRDKTISCNHAGYRLIQVLSSEWYSIRPVVLSRLKNALGLTDVVYGRSCSIKQLSTPEAQVFFTDTHIQGFAAGTVYFGLEHDGKLVAAMSFCKSRFNNQYEWELLRYSSAVGVRVVGGASKLFTHFMRAHLPASVISYCDLRWGTGNLYRALGFNEIKVSPPNYFYFRRTDGTHQLMSRQVFQKHKLRARLESFDEACTEWQNMQNNGFDKIWDCGNGVWAWVK